MFERNTIHETAIIGQSVDMGYHNVIGPYAVIEGHTALGNGNQIRAHAVIGTPAEKHGFFDKHGMGVLIGNRNQISEHVTIHAGTTVETTIMDDCVILTKAHVGHDSMIADKATISCSVLVGGHSWIGTGANIGLGASLHQYSRIGAWAMVGMGSVVKRQQKIIPGSTYVGVPARFVRNNSIGLQRQGITQEQLQAAIVAYRLQTQEWPDDSA